MKKKISSLGILSATLMFRIAVPATIFAIDKKNNMDLHAGFEDVAGLMLETNGGAPLRLNLTNKPIKVAIENFSEQDKKQVVSAIERLDNISKNLNYTILDSDHGHIDADIKIRYESFDNNMTLGNTQLTFNENTAVIKYPINIQIDPSVKDWRDSETNETALSFVVKHEMMHTLGFCDIYDQELMNKTIMYYSIATVDDYTTMDEMNIKKLYDDRLVTVKRANMSDFVVTFANPNTKKEKSEEDEFSL